MRKLALLAAILVTAASAFGQAIAEGALTHAMSTATGTAMGKALGNVTNQMAAHVASRLGQQTAAPAAKSKVQSAKPAAQASPSITDYGTTAEPPAGGSMIASIQGAAPQPVCDPTAQDAQDKQSNAALKTAACPATSDAHPSEITLPAAR